MEYYDYKIARNLAWKVLIECDIREFSVNLAKIINHYGIYLIRYSESDYINRHSSPNEDGFSRLIDCKPVIYYNDKKPIYRARFTLAHEIGHILLGHLANGETLHRNTEYDVLDVREQQANVFARDLLMPAIVLHNLNIKSSEDIARICNVSMLSAEIRYSRLLELEKRNMFNRHPLEKAVHKQFIDYIDKTKL